MSNSFLTSARTALRMTQTDFARLLGRSQATVSRMEKGRVAVTLEDVVAIRRACREQRVAFPEDVLREATR